MTSTSAQKPLTRRGKINARVNLVIAACVFVLGTASVFVSLADKNEADFFLEFRFMTMNGTIFTTLIALITLIVSALELKNKRKSRVVHEKLYYFRLCSAVTETIIAVVVAMSFLPFVPDNPNILTFESFNMHVIIPPLTIFSFLADKTPEKRLSPLLRFNCAWLITCYAVIVITMIVVGWIPQEKIPYSFLDYRTHPIWYMICFGCFIYSFTYVLSFLFTDLNRRISFYWIEENETTQ